MDSIGSFDDSSDFPIPTKSAVLFSRPRPRFHARKKIALYISGKVYSVQMRENADQNNSEYGHFLRSDSFRFLSMSTMRNSIKLLTLSYHPKIFPEISKNWKSFLDL